MLQQRSVDHRGCGFLKNWSTVNEKESISSFTTSDQAHAKKKCNSYFDSVILLSDDISPLTLNNYHHTRQHFSRHNFSPPRGQTKMLVRHPYLRFPEGEMIRNPIISACHACAAKVNCNLWLSRDQRQWLSIANARSYVFSSNVLSRRPQIALSTLLESATDTHNS